MSATPLSNAIVELDCRSGGPFEISLALRIHAGRSAGGAPA
jgi:hypothetical protein